MRPFDGINERSIVIMDNCSIHHVSEVKKLFEDAGILVFYLPPYSPDMSPIEETFSSIKYYLRDHDELMQVTDNPMSIVQAAFDQVNYKGTMPGLDKRLWILIHVTVLDTLHYSYLPFV